MPPNLITDLKNAGKISLMEMKTILSKHMKLTHIPHKVYKNKNIKFSIVF